MTDDNGIGYRANRMPPHNLSAERGLLGAIMIDNRAHEYVSEYLRSEHFMDTNNQIIYAAMCKIIDGGNLANPITIQKHFDNSEYLVALAGEAVTVVNAGQYGQIVLECHNKRQLIDACNEAIALAYDETDKSASKIIEETALSLDMISESGDVGRDARHMNEVVIDAVEAVEKAARGEAVPVITTGIHALDRPLVGFQNGDLAFIGSRPGMGKEQPVDCKVLTPDGWVEIGSLIVGDYLIGRNGKPTKVVGVFPQGVKAAYRVSFRDGTSTECGLNHLWSVAPCDGNQRKVFKTRSLKEILDLGICRNRTCGRKGARWRIPLVDAVEFPYKFLPIDPYVLGVLIGDGSISGNELRFSNPDIDSDIRSRFRDRMPDDLYLHEGRYGNACPYYDLRGEGKKQFKSLINMLKLSVRSGQKFVPKIYLKGAIYQRILMLQGLMDTDGGCRKSRTSFYTTSKQLSQDVASLVRSLGGLAIIRKYDRTKESKPIEYVVNVKTSFPPFKTSRKLAQWKPHDPSRYIYSVEYSRTVEQVCIMVDANDHLYVTDDFIVTHNTVLAVTIAVNVARRGIPVLLYTLEMEDIKIAARTLARDTGISTSRQRKGEVASDREWSSLIEAAGDLGKLPLYIDDRPALTISAARSRARRMKRKHGIGLVIVDYMQLMQSGDRYSGSRVNEISEITRGLKLLARELNVPIIALSQLSRQVESRDNKRPMLSDLRESGSTEQDADIVMFLYREHYYLKDLRPVQGPKQSNNAYDIEIDEWEDRLVAIEHDAEIIIAKHREGETGIAHVYFNGEKSFIGDKATTQQEDMNYV